MPRMTMADLARLCAATGRRPRPSPAGPGAPAARLRDGAVLLWDALDLHLLDVRPAEAFAAGHIPDAASIPAPELRARAHELPQRRDRLVIVAAAGDRALGAAAALAAAGDAGKPATTTVGKATPGDAGEPASAPVAVADGVASWPGPWETGPARRVLWQSSPSVRAWTGRLPAGRALDLGCGSGRDAAWLAAAGHDVLAVDRLPEALERAARLAAATGSTLRTLALDLRRDRPPVTGDGYDLVLMVRFLDRALLPWVAQAVRPGGCFILEAFARGPDAGGPRRDRWVLEPQEALRAILAPGAGGWTVLEYQEGAAGRTDGLTRLVARKGG